MAEAHSKQVGKQLKLCRVDDGKGFTLSDHPTRADLTGMRDSDEAKAALQAGVERLAQVGQHVPPPHAGLSDPVEQAVAIHLQVQIHRRSKECNPAWVEGVASGNPVS